ncbi:MAG: site-specific integrase [Pirellulales bacterium]|nr:site-specific integrase [Pirellulales bacterium]
MASLNSNAKHWRIEFKHPLDKRRRTIYLPVNEFSADDAGIWHVHVEAVLASLQGKSIPPQTLKWLNRLDDAPYQKLANANLVESRLKPQPANEWTVDAWVTTFIENKADVQQSTKETYRHIRRNLADFFGANKRLKDVTDGDALEFYEYMQGKAGLSIATALRRTALAKQIFRRAVKKGHIPTNPFEDITGLRVKANDQRFVEVTEEMTAKLVDAMPNAEWRLAVVLARYGGLRVPSELLPLRWQDVDWHNRRIKVTNVKTCRKTNKPHRIIPLWERIRPYLEACFDQAEAGAEYVFPEIRKLGQAGRDKGTNTIGLNLRTALDRYAAYAGVELWEKPWQNMRSTCATELIAEYPSHIVNAWMGHSEEIAQEHYRQVKPQDFETALARERQALDKAKSVTKNVTYSGTIKRAQSQSRATASSVKQGKSQPVTFDDSIVNMCTLGPV